MSKARNSIFRTGFVHVALIAYTLVSLFPVFLTIINSFKDRNAIFRAPLTIPTPQTFSLIDKSVQKGVIKKNTAARYKSRLTKSLNTIATA